MEINLYGMIDEQTAQNFSENLRGNQGDVVVHINSNGGNIFSALTINTLLKTRNTTAIIEGLCASAATIVALGAKNIKMAQNGLFMIHAPETLLVDYVNAAALEQMKTTLEKIEASIVAIYQSRVPSFTMPEAELWLNGTEAKALGFVDEILDETPEIYVDAAQKIIGYNGQYFNMSGCKTIPAKIESAKPAAQKINAVIMDQMTSGAQNVSGSATLSEQDMKVNLLINAIKGAKRS